MLTALALAFASLCSLQPPGDLQPKAPDVTRFDCVIADVTIINPATAEHQPGQWVAIVGEHIVAVYSGIPAMPQPRRTIDGRGLYLIPGLIDSHVHYVDEATFGPLFLAHGVTLVRDLGGDTTSILNIRDRLNSGALLGPRMIATGAIIDGKPAIWPFSEECETPEQARAAVQKLKAAGVDQIKVYSLLKPDVYAAACDEAHKVGLHPVGHIPSSVTIHDAVAAGQLTAEHMLGIQPLILDACPPAPDAAPQRGLSKWADTTGWKRLHEADPAKLRANLESVRALVQVPTVCVMEGVARAIDPDREKDPNYQFVPAHLRSFWNGPQYSAMAKGITPHLPAMKAMVGELYRAGVPMLIGTDLANPYVYAGASLHREMQIFQEAGVPARDVLRMATTDPAHVFGLEKDYGPIEPGKIASIVLLRKDPTQDITSARAIEGVFLAGRYFDRPVLDQLLVDARAAADASQNTSSRVTLALPGEVIQRGRYTISFKTGNQGTLPAGSEEFLFTKSDDGYRILSHSQPEGGWTKPALTSIHAGTQWGIISATFETLTKSPTKATYTFDGTRFHVEASDNAQPAQPQTFDAPKTMVFAPPSTATSCVMLNALSLQPGDSLDASAVGFGFPGWKLDSTPMTITRQSDTPLPAGGPPLRCYTTALTSPMGKVEQKFWMAANGLIARCEVKIPYGTSITELVDEPAAPAGQPAQPEK